MREWPKNPGPVHHASGDGASGGLTRTGQVPLVTGGSAGLGLAIARTLADADSDIVLASRSAKRCQQAAAPTAAYLEEPG
jgi:gluconate 5-dehydrogenase